MANYFSHPRYRTRNFEYARLDQTSLKKYKAAPVNTNMNLEWSRCGSVTLQLQATREENSLFIYTEPSRGYHVYFDETLLTYGKRNWFLCPSCGGRCAILYHAQHFACRKCVKPAYESQNGSKTDSLITRVRFKRKKLWPDMSEDFRDDMLDRCDWFPKPKGMHEARFEREKSKIIQLENSFIVSAQQLVKNLISGN